MNEIVVGKRLSELIVVVVFVLLFVDVDVVLIVDGSRSFSPSRCHERPGYSPLPRRDRCRRRRGVKKLTRSKTIVSSFILQR